MLAQVWTYFRLVIFMSIEIIKAYWTLYTKVFSKIEQEVLIMEVPWRNLAKQELISSLITLTPGTIAFYYTHTQMHIHCLSFAKADLHSFVQKLYCLV